MRLIGNYLSPFTRRVAISLTALDIPFELEELTPFKKPEPVREYNPVVRIPTLVFDDGDALFESHVILDAIDQLVGPDRALTPASGPSRRRVMKIAAVATASMEKAQWAFYEVRFHPAEKVYQWWIDHNESQTIGGLKYLDQLAKPVRDEGWIAGTERMSQADISAAVAYSFVKAVRPELSISKSASYLAEFARRCEAMDVFRAAPVPPSLPS
ncbi:MAG: glutathione S-transferase family protein [Arenicellales bacterium]|nr:glutathione S-transferase family protein [Arenicellales bacterium]